MRELVEQFLSTTKLQPRKYQTRVITKTLKHFLEDEVKSVMIESPTGSGKTSMTLSIIKILQNKYPDMKCGWISMRRNLLSQAESENKRHGINANIEFISMFEKNPPTNLDMLMIDEGQHDSTNSCAHLHNTIKPKWILSCTATPFRTDKVKLCFDKVVKDAGIHRLIQEGYLSPYHHFSIPEWGVDSVANFYLQSPDRWGKTLVFFHSIRECFQLQSALRDRGFESEVVTGFSDREEQLDRFKNDNDCNVCINCMVLTEGFDFDRLQTIFCRPSGKPTTIQMCGRAFRIHPSISFKNIIQPKQTKWPFAKTALPLMQHIWIKDGWRSVEPNKKTNFAQKKVMKAISQIKVELPKLITEKKEKARNPLFRRMRRF